ncbi:RHS repeat-associated core domain protein [Candidatus Magnetomorum sp. HK-1]|nr:RHS repeat-associated core domain protein [Candidatus Magnetomorum sp. HK-1]
MSQWQASKILKRHTDVYSVLGGRTPIDASFAIASFRVVISLMEKMIENNYAPSDMLLANIVSAHIQNRFFDQLLNNALSVHMGHNVLKYIELPSSTYNPPPGVSAILDSYWASFNDCKTDDCEFFKLVDKKSNLSYEFEPDTLEGSDSYYRILKIYNTHKPPHIGRYIHFENEYDDNKLRPQKVSINYPSIYQRPVQVLFFEFTYGDKEFIVSDSSGRQVKYTCNDENQLESYKDPENYEWTYTYDDINQMTSHTDPNRNRQIFNIYDPLGRVKEQTNARNYNYKYYYSGYRNMEEDPEGNRISYFFDKDRLVGKENALGHKVTNMYDGQGHLVKTISARGLATEYTYDGNHNLVFVKDSTSRIESYEYDSNHNLLFFTNRSGHKTEYKYDPDEQLTDTIDPEKNLTKRDYYYYYGKSAGLLQSETDAKGNKDTYYYDSYGFINYVKHESNTGTIRLKAVYCYKYNSRGQLEYFYESKDISKLRAIDVAIQLSSCIGLQSTNCLDYFIDRTRKYRYVYDKRGLLKEEYGPLHPDLPIRKYIYDGAGNLKEKYELKNPVQASYSLVKYGYSPTNKLTYVYNYSSNGELISDIHYSYRDDDILWHISNTHYYYGFYTTKKMRYMTFRHDSINRIKSYTFVPYFLSIIEMGSGNTYQSNSEMFKIQYFYDEETYIGKMTGMQYDSMKLKYTYDNLNRLKTITDVHNNLTTEYRYDKLDKENHDMIETQHANGTITQSVYDTASRLIGLSNQRSNKTRIAEYHYELDPLGNREKESSTAFTNGRFNPGQKTVSHAHNIANQISNTGFTYDELGKMTNQPGIDYHYNHEEQLDKVTGTNSSTSYTYDMLGNRLEVKKGGTTSKYLVDPTTSNVLMEKNSSGTKYYVYGQGLEYAIGTDGKDYHYHYDGIGNTVAITDQDEEIVNLYAYSPYGEVLYSIETVPNSFKYVGKEGVMDDGNGLYYMRARYYDPMLGRFISRDPIGHEGGLNLYAYAGNNPVMFVDPSGLYVVFWGAGASAGIGNGNRGGMHSLSISRYVGSTKNGAYQKGFAISHDQGKDFGANFGAGMFAGLNFGNVEDYKDVTQIFGLDIGGVSIDINFNNENALVGFSVALGTRGWGYAGYFLHSKTTTCSTITYGKNK